MRVFHEKLLISRIIYNLTNSSIVGSFIGQKWYYIRYTVDTSGHWLAECQCLSICISKNNSLHSKSSGHQTHRMPECESRIPMQRCYYTTPQRQLDAAPNSQDATWHWTTSSEYKQWVTPLPVSDLSYLSHNRFQAIKLLYLLLFYYSSNIQANPHRNIHTQTYKQPADKIPVQSQPPPTSFLGPLQVGPCNIRTEDHGGINLITLWSRPWAQQPPIKSIKTGQAVVEKSCVE